MLTNDLVAYLNERLDVEVYPEVPSERPDEFCVVRLVAGRQPNRVEIYPSFEVDAWSTTRPKAEALANQVKVALIEAVSLPSVFYVEIDTFYDNRDPDSGSPRYTVGCDITATE